MKYSIVSRIDVILGDLPDLLSKVGMVMKESVDCRIDPVEELVAWAVREDFAAQAAA